MKDVGGGVGGCEEEEKEDEGVPPQCGIASLIRLQAQSASWRRVKESAGWLTFVEIKRTSTIVEEGEGERERDRDERTVTTTRRSSDKMVLRSESSWSRRMSRINHSVASTSLGIREWNLHRFDSSFSSPASYRCWVIEIEIEIEISCRAMPRHTMPYHAMPCHAMPCHATPCRGHKLFIRKRGRNRALARGQRLRGRGGVVQNGEPSWLVDNGITYSN
uniref:Uncharacterized protein n=1 Tax=Vespula pensylvanica TaxID=30213 RepID=A0A834UCF9_VESPE|nr:hypothetical protein H0235_006236 [Vespula pensylvanica]